MDETVNDKPQAGPPVSREFLSKPLHFLAVGLGAGCAPVAPGTFGTLVGTALFLLFRPMSVTEYVAVVAALFIAGVWICGRAAAALAVPDHPAIVWDEIVGILITMTAAPRGWSWLVAGFLLFRFLDVVKPWPIRWFDRHVHGGLGIMLDDAVAGLFAFASLQITAYLIYG